MSDTIRSIGFAPGTAAIWAALLFGLATIATYLRVLKIQTAGGPAADVALMTGFARRLYAAFAGSILLASVLLLGLLLSHDFRVTYVAAYSGRDLPFNYLFSTFWAGQEGSFMLWLFWGAIIGFFVLATAKEQEAPVMSVYVLSFVAIVVILCKQSPFRFLAQIPADGQGLNPLLQDPWMVIHPPVMFAGFASLSVPFAFAIAALWTKRWDGWVVRAMPWALFTFITLGTAILMGGYWAYKTLGWGGYWAWDPVENTSLVPWLFTVALLHGMYLQRTRAKHRKINILLAILTYSCILYGTFLTRSGVLADFSVHSFVESGLKNLLGVVILVFLFGGLGLLAWRWREIPVVGEVDPATGKQKEEPFLSRSVLFILSVALVCASATVILLGTSAPILTGFFSKPSQVATSFYNITHVPVAILIGLLIALVPYLSWRGETGGSVARKAVAAFAVGLLGAGVAFAAGVRGAGDLALIGFAVFGFAANVESVILFARRRVITSAGGYLAHVGVGIMLVGILISGAYARKVQVTLVRGTPTRVGSHTMTFTRAVVVNEDGVVKQQNELNPALLADRRAKQAMEVEVAVGGGKVWKAYPKMYENERTRQLMANPDVRSTPLADLYLSPQSYDPGTPSRIEGTKIPIRPDERKTLGGVAFTSKGFFMDRSQMNANPPSVAMNAKFLVESGGKSTEQTAKLVMFMGAQGEEGMQQAPEVPIPGVPNGRFRISRVSGSDGAMEIEVLGLSAGGDLKPPTPESFSVDVTFKPLISLVWAGFYVLMAGGLVALIRRGRDAHAAVVG
ncbi:MAG: heme lyase CcmF/NrfE family subunit [Thermoanaerobaculia bacterium]